MATSSNSSAKKPGRPEPDATAGEARAGAGGLPSVGDVTQWGMALTGEAMRLPTTVARARKVVAVLPDHLEELVAALDRFTHLLEHSLGEVRDEVRDVGGRLENLQTSIDGLAAQLGTTTDGIDQAMPTLSQAVLRLEQRLEGMDHLLGELGGTVVGTINAVPGLRRVSRRGQSAKARPELVAPDLDPESDSDSDSDSESMGAEQPAAD